MCLCDKKGLYQVEKKVFEKLIDLLFFIDKKSTLDFNDFELKKVSCQLKFLRQYLHQNSNFVVTLDLKKIALSLNKTDFESDYDILKTLKSIDTLFMGNNPDGISRNRMLMYKNCLSSIRLDFKEREQKRLSDWKKQITAFVKIELCINDFQIKPNCKNAIDYAKERTYDFYFSTADIIFKDNQLLNSKEEKQ